MNQQPAGRPVQRVALQAAVALNQHRAVLMVPVGIQNCRYIFAMRINGVVSSFDINGIRQPFAHWLILILKKARLQSFI